MKVYEKVRILVRSWVQSAEKLEAIKEGVANQSELINQRLHEIVLALENQTELINRRMTELVAASFGKLMNDIGPETAGPAQTEPHNDSRKLDQIVAPVVDLAKSADPVGEILAAPLFKETVDFFGRNDALRISLVSRHGQALLYSLVRNQKPSHVVEVGCFKGGTTEAIARALETNGHGIVHAIGPFDRKLFAPTYQGWPVELQRRAKYYEENSAAFFGDMKRRGIKPDLVFVDGNHDYEYALFDIACAARAIARRGFIVIDNLSQAGPFQATLDFLQNNPDWEDCVKVSRLAPSYVAYNRDRSPIANVDFAIIRAPQTFAVRQRPITFGESLWQLPQVSGLSITVDAPSFGTLHAQCVLRGFSADSQVEVVCSDSCNLNGQVGKVDIVFKKPAVAAIHDHYRVEPWLAWDGVGTLALRAEPEVL